MAEKKLDNERRSVRELLGLKGGHREYKINGVTYVVSGQYHDEKKDGTDKTFADRIEDFIGSEFAELTDIDEGPNLKKNNVHRAAGKER
ncbi:MAG: hypothetical protein IKW76_11635 [Clostridia bacterium]|nr:hypothetical protein [Clostridia bacterium]